MFNFANKYPFDRQKRSMKSYRIQTQNYQYQKKRKNIPTSSNNLKQRKMKKSRTLVMAMCLILGTVSLQAQFKMNQNGKMLLGNPYPTQDLNNVLTGSLFGPNGNCRSGAKLAFGDFGRIEYGGGNVFIGEYTDADTDQLWLHGKNGIYLTTGGSTIVTRLSLTTTGATFLQSVYAPGFYISSDSRFKSNVTVIKEPLTHLMKLSGVKYDYNDKAKDEKYTIKYDDNADDKDTPKEEPSEKEKVSMEADALLAAEREKAETRTGFIAQDMQKIFPHLVKEDETGFLSIDYTGLIPVIVEAMREQQNIIEAQGVRIAQLEKILNGTNKTSPQDGGEGTGQTSITKEEMTETAFLFQNTPNPFHENTEIRYSLPQGNENAELRVFDMQGKNIITKKLQGQGEGRIIIEGSKLSSGTYIYILYANGKEVDSKRMILTK